MCIVPGTLSTEVARRSETARRRASWLRVMLYALLLLAALRILSFSIWSAISDSFAAMYGFVMLRTYFSDEDRVVMLEPLLVLAIMLAFLASIDVMTLITIVTKTQMLQQDLVEWQSIVGTVVCGVALAVYLATGLAIWALYRSLKETVIVSPDETSSFLQGPGGDRSIQATSSQPGSIFGAFSGVTAMGRAAAPLDSATPVNERFPGKGYRLDV